MDLSRVILVGGAPLVGKTTLCQAMARQLGRVCISQDDVVQGIRSVTTPASHPGFHVMDGWDYRDYYVQRSTDELMEDANRQHEATWPVIEELARVHASYRGPAIIEGWGIMPDRAAELLSASIAGIWLVADEQMLETRLRRSKGFLAGASDPEGMIQGYLNRSLWFNRAIQEQADMLGLPALHITDGRSVEELVAAACELLIEC